MRHPQSARWLMMTIAGLLTLGGVLTGSPQSTNTNEPDLTNVKDILGHQRHYLLRNDDLVVTFSGFNTGGAANQVLRTTHSSISAEGSNYNFAFSDIGAGIATAVGRVFNTPYDVTVSVATSFGQTGRCPAQQAFCLVLNIRDDVRNLTQAQFISVPNGQPAETVYSVTMADFTGDGYADVLVYYDCGTNCARFIQIFTAVDPNDPANPELQGGPQLEVGSGSANVGAFAVGDFDGDEQPDIVEAHIGSALQLTYYTVDPKTLAISAKPPASPLTVPAAGTGPMAATVGRLWPTPQDDLRKQDQLIVFYASDSAHNARVLAIDTDAQFKPTLQATLDMDVEQEIGKLDLTRVMAQASQWDGNGPFDQLLVAGTTTARPSPTKNPSGFVFVVVASKDDNGQVHLEQKGKIQISWDGDSTPFGCLVDMAVGRFDPAPPTPQSVDLDLGVALLGINGPCGTTDDDPDLLRASVAIYSRFFVRQSVYQPTFVEADPHGVMRITAGDTQGRSLFLGPPEKVTITSRIQPEFVLGIPPMHIDYIRDAAHVVDGPPTELNISVIPSVPASVAATAFSTEFSFSASTSDKTKRKSTTSYSVSTKEDADTKVSFGVPDVDSVSVDVKTSTKQKHDTTVSSTYNTSSGQTDSLSTTSGFADRLFYTVSTLTIYYYPVIGQCVAAAGAPAAGICPAGTRQLYVQFSGTTAMYYDTDATEQEWYQPVWEPGNIFSYPWDLSQVQQAFPALVPLTPDPPTWRATDTGAETITTTWTEGSGSTQTSGATNINSFDTSVTVSGDLSYESASVDASASFEYSTSQSISTMNTTTQTLDSSTGVTVNKPDFDSIVANNYVHYFGGYVFGQSPTAGTLQTIPLTDAQGEPIRIQSAGPLMVAFVADYQGPAGAEPWWGQAYIRPDVGLNHPERWDWDTLNLKASFNCAAPDTGNCAGTPALALDRPFYHIKGFFITPLDADNSGPQLTTAVEGTPLSLRARVHNYSLADMPAGTQVHVRFYGQVFDNSSTNVSGDSFLIGEDVIAPICGFKSSSPNCTGKSNWTWASTTFDTTGRATQDLVFWVLVWMEDGNGNLVPELEGHGLTQKPEGLALAQITDVPVEAYSNNVGFYGYMTRFYVAPQDSLTAGPPMQVGDLTVGPLIVPTTPLLLETKARVTAQLHTGDNHLGSLLLAFYDGDPQQGGEVFHIQTIPHLHPNSTYQTRAFYRPKTCGAHTLFLVAGPATPSPATTSTTVEVTINPIDVVEGLIANTTSLGLPQPEAWRLLGKLRTAQHAFQHNFLRVAANRLTAFIGEVEVQRGQTLTDQQASRLIGQAKVILDCV